MGNVEIPLGNTLPDMVIVIVLCVLVDTDDTSMYRDDYQADVGRDLCEWQ